MHLFSSRFFRGARPAALVALTLLAGCGRDLESETVGLAALADRTLTWSLTDVDYFEGVEPEGSHRFTVTFSLAQDDRCTRLGEGVTATFNGAPMRLEPGGIDDTAGRGVCVPTRAFLDFDPNVWGQEPTEDARVVLQDGSATVSLVLRGGKAKRRLAFQGAGDADRLTRGQTYTYQWQPAGEVPASVNATLLREGGSAAANIPLTQDAARVSFTVPAGTPVANHLLTLSGSAPGTLLECTGVASCEGTVFHSEEIVVTVQ
ncbi:hypothetical protein HPC49_49765 [Pyxidicoccus fallax]|uniref:Lipoprotein n=1 Tax=Pyxidicoccus fallax TaxID=394095 RepID=A0A848LYC5_9BACT|nr:hypothetical protein [Pyxidicoccus fallax]NMO22214.1 hypothetical protein [Pyxidicoccus fallax]NPC86264.1 hypothetical protein [Pyxidicoccus fallax]